TAAGNARTSARRLVMGTPGIRLREWKAVDTDCSQPARNRSETNGDRRPRCKRPIRAIHDSVINRYSRAQQRGEPTWTGTQERRDESQQRKHARLHFCASLGDAFANDSGVKSS